MNTNHKKWWGPVLVVVIVGLAVTGGYLLLGGERLRGFFSRGVWAGNASDHSADLVQGVSAHGGDEPTVATTIWAERADVFLERPYPVAGKPVEMLIHVTVLRDGSAVTEGSVTFQATGPQQSVVKVRVDQPRRPGIFIPEVTFPKAGTYQARLLIETPQLESRRETIELPDVAVYADSDAALAAAENAAEDEPADAISFLKEQQWPIGLRTVEVREQELVERLAVPGRVIVPPGAGAVVGSPVSGKVAPKHGGRFPRVGEKVRQGELLAVVEPSITGADAVQLVANQAQLQTLDADLAVKQLEMETQIQGAELALARAKEVYGRKRKLSEQGVTAGKELLLAEHELKLAESRLAGLRKLLEPYTRARQRLAAVLDRMQSAGETGDRQGDLRITLRSPIGGTIVQSRATSGELITGNQQVFRIVNLDVLWIEANVSEYDLRRVQEAPNASYRLAAYPDRIVPIFDGGGRLIDIGAEVDAETRTVPIRYQVPNREGTLRVGMFADLLIETDRRQRCLAVPKEAVVDEGGQPVVYIQTGGESFQRRPVQLGIRDANLVEVLSGVERGERVATKGAYSVRLSTLASGLPAHGHAH